MLPTFVTGLREGREAALITGIIAAFLGLQGRRDVLRQAGTGVTGCSPDARHRAVDREEPECGAKALNSWRYGL